MKGIEGKLNSLVRAFTSTNDPRGVKPAKPAKLDQNDMAAIYRAFTEVEYVLDDNNYIDWDTTIENLKEAPKFKTIIQPYFRLLGVDDLQYSYWHSIVQMREPLYSCLTSPMMLAARANPLGKSRHEVAFNAWKNGLSRSDWWILFGRVLADDLLSPAMPSVADWERIKPNAEMYKYVLKDPSNPLGFFLSPIPELYDELEDDEGGPKLLWEGFNSWPRIVKHMKLQTWICHPSVRLDSMVLNPFNWDYIPEPISSLPAATVEQILPVENVKQSKAFKDLLGDFSPSGSGVKKRPDIDDLFMK